MKTVKLEVTMENMPDGASAEGVAKEVREMLEKEYADGVKVYVSEQRGPEVLAKAERPEAEDEEEEVPEAKRPANVSGARKAGNRG